MRKAPAKRLTPLQKLGMAFLMLSLIIVVGTTGLIWLEKMSLLDALYMTVITLSTVGFGEVQPLHPQGRVFIIILIWFGVAFAGFTVSVITQFVVEGELKDLFGRRKMESRIRKMTDHYIIAGYGRVGRQVALEFHKRQVPFVVIEKNEEEIRRLTEEGILFLQGEATDDEVLHRAGINSARTLISTLPDEAENVYLTLSARAINKNLKIIARADFEEGEKKLILAGADHVVSPHVLGGLRMAMASLRPNVVDFMHMASLGEGGLSIEEVVIPPACRLAGKSLVDSNLKQTYGVTIIGIKKTGAKMAFAPGPDTVLGESDILVLLGPTEQLERLSRDLS
ncbi:MAG TPA: NAD-binding protein [Candidatus Deferrimicrobium sp.]|nr:NAD-binding protein [Candidatus Deferrimicrobium sp.]